MDLELIEALRTALGCEMPDHPEKCKHSELADSVHAIVFQWYRSKITKRAYELGGDSPSDEAWNAAYLESFEPW